MKKYNKILFTIFVRTFNVFFSFRISDKTSTVIQVLTLQRYIFLENLLKPNNSFDLSIVDEAFCNNSTIF